MIPDYETMLAELQEEIGRGNAERGFHDEGATLRTKALSPLDWEDAKAPLSNYYITKLALIVTEAGEAIEELRNGRLADETYYSGGVGEEELHPSQPIDLDGSHRKPEGVPSELADIVIRCFDFASEAGIDLGAIIVEKLEYNATRGRMHGGKKV